MGARLGRYTVLKHLVSGGMADVLLGRTDGIEGFERHVVLKRIRPEYANDHRFIRMFLDEARVAANLHHQHIVQVHDVGESLGEYFIAMEYIHGEDVRTILSKASKSRAHVPLGYAIAIVAAAAAGLHYAHERRGADKRPLGIVHRDVSPSNILVGYDGSIKVVDFGIAKAAMKQETRSGTLKGKVSYMSPEQCKGHEIDRRSDVYSLGVVLYELATTTRLFKGDNDYLVMDQIVNGRVSPPSARRPDLPDELSAIIMQALATDPERRYASADELRVALDQFAQQAGLTASTSVIAAYMRQQFGERPEPWLEIGSTLDDVPTPVGGSGVSAQGSWKELGRSQGSRPSAAIAHPSGPDGIGSALVPAAMESHDLPPRTAETRSTSKARATESKMGWESQQPAARPRGLGPAKIAAICAPLVLVLGFAIWRLGGTGSTISPAAAPATAPMAASATGPMAAPATGPMATPATAPTAPSTAAPAPGVTPSSEPNPPGTGVATTPEVAVAEPEVPAEAPAPTASAPPSKRSPISSSSSRKAPSKGGGITTAALSPSSSDAKPGAGHDTKVATPESPSSGVPSSTAFSPTVPSPTTPAATPPAPTATPPAPTPAPPAPTPTPSAAPPPVAVPPTAPAADVAPPQLLHATVERVASDHSRELSKCDGGQDLHGEVKVKFAVDASGKVTKTQMSSTIKKPKVSGCILRSVQGWRFPKQGASGAQGTYTLSFQ